MAAALAVADGVVIDVRIALERSPIPWRAHRAEQALRDDAATEQAFKEAADVELAQAQPLRDNRYKIPLLQNLMVRTLSELLETS